MSQPPKDGAPDRTGRSGSETRRRKAMVNIRFSDEERNRVEQLAEGSGYSVAALIRNRLLSTPLPRQRRPRADVTAVAQLLAELAAVRAELGKSGSNLNQIAFQLNADRDVASLPDQLAVVIEEHEEALRLLLELRGGCMRALGLEMSGED